MSRRPIPYEPEMSGLGERRRQLTLLQRIGIAIIGALIAVIGLTAAVLGLDWLEAHPEWIPLFIGMVVGTAGAIIAIAIAEDRSDG